jgi:hypothetical protein
MTPAISRKCIVERKEKNLYRGWIFPSAMTLKKSGIEDELAFEMKIL